VKVMQPVGETTGVLKSRRLVRRTSYYQVPMSRIRNMDDPDELASASALNLDRIGRPPTRAVRSV